MYLLWKNVYSHVKKKSTCSCINIRVFTSEESISTRKEKNICSCINVFVFASVYSHAKKKVLYAHV